MSKARTWLPKMWGGSAFVGKFWLPTILFGASWLLAARPIPNLFSVLFSLALVVPMILIAVFFLMVPGQLRLEGDTLGYRKWFRWQIFQSSQVEKVSEAFLAAANRLRRAFLAGDDHRF